MASSLDTSETRIRMVHSNVPFSSIYAELQRKEFYITTNKRLYSFCETSHLTREIKHTKYLRTLCTTPCRGIVCVGLWWKSCQVNV
jgi:hypothetical protein